MKLRAFLYSRKVLASLTVVLAMVAFMQFFVLSNAIGGEATAEKAAEKDVAKETTTPIMRPQFRVNQNYSLIDPFQEMCLMKEEMDKLFAQVFNRFQTSPGFIAVSPNQMIFSPRIDLKDDGKNYIVKMDLPGVKKDDIKITLRSRLLTISGKRKEEVKEKTDKMVTMERRLGEFARTFSLPGPIDENKLKAVCQDGVLTVTLPKTNKEKEEIEIKVEGQ